MRRPKLKVPFDLHPSVTARAQIALARVTDLALSSGGLLAVASDGNVVLVGEDGQRVAAKGELAGAKAQYVSWSNDGQRIATLTVEWQGNDMTAHIAVHGLDGARIATATMPDWGYVSHATPGALAPMMAFSADGKRLYVRSATMRDPQGSAMGVLDVDVGSFTRHPLGESWVFSIAPAGERVFALYGRVGDDAGLVWLDAETFAKRGRAPALSGECVVPGASSVWVVGDDRYVWHVDAAAIEHGKAPASPKVAWDAMRTLRWERHQQLTSRARSQWDKDELERRAGMDEAWSPPEGDGPGVQCFMHPEPCMIAQACRAGDDDLLVRDGVRVSRWSVREGKLDVTSLVDDPQRATPSKARLLMLASQPNRFVLGWRKALNAEETYCTLFDEGAR
jgi:hypothetical protein